MIHVLDVQTETILATLENKVDAALYWNDVHEDTLKNNQETFDFTMLASVPAAEHVSKRNLIIIPDEDGHFREFIIRETYQFDRKKEVRCFASFVEIAKQKIIDPIVLEGQTIQTAANHILPGTDWQVGIAEGLSLRKVEFTEHTDALTALRMIATLFGLELRFRVVTKANKVIARYVDFIKRDGSFKGKEIELGKDLIGIKRHESSDVYTALIGLGPEREDGTRLIVRVEDKDALQRWGKKGRHLWGVYTPDSSDLEMTKERLTTLTKTELDKRINTIVQYEAEAASIEHILGYEHEKVRKGDSVRIKDTSYIPPLYLDARIISVKRAISNKSKKSFVLGDFIEYTEDEIMATFKALKAVLRKKASSADIVAVKEYAEQVAETAEGNAKDYAEVVAVDAAALAEEKAKEYADGIKVDDSKFLDTPPPKPTLQATGLFKKVLLEWDAVFSSYMAYYEIYAGTAAGFTPSAENLVDKVPSGNYVFEGNVNTTYYFKIRGVNRAGTAGPYSDEVSASTVDLTPDDFDESTIPEFIDMGIIKQDTEPAGTSYAVGQLWIDTSKNPNLFRRWNGSSWDKLAPTSAAEVGTYTSTQIDNALNAKASKTVVDSLSGTVTNHETRITQTESDVALKASQSSVDGLAGRVSTAESNITANAREIATKVSQTDFNALEGRMDSAESSITQNAGQIALKVSQTTYDLDVGNLKTRMTSAESSITQHADQIALKVEKNGVISSINQTAESIKINASKVQIDGDLTVTNGLVRIKDGIITNKMIASNAMIDAAKIGEIDAGKLKAGSVIADDIIFKGKLQGATGTFSGDLNAASGSFIGSLSAASGTVKTLEVLGDYGGQIVIGTGYWNASGSLWTPTGDVVFGNDTSSTEREIVMQSYEGDVYFNLGGSMRLSGNLTASGMLKSHGVTSSGFIKTTKTEEALIFDTALDTERSYLRFKKAGVSKGYIGTQAATDNIVIYGYNGIDLTSYNGVIALRNGCMINTDGSIARFQQSNTNYWSQSSTIAGIYFGGSIKHSFRSDGTKAGGSIEIDGVNLGMSPIDSPQILLEYVEFDIPLDEQGVKVFLETRFRKGIANFAVFPNNGTILEKGYDYFVIAGTGTADCRIVGERAGYENVFWADMAQLNEIREEPAV